MATRQPTRRKKTDEQPLQPTQPSLSLKIESGDDKHPHVDADDFLTTAEKWLRSLKAFATEQGKAIRWEIVDLRKSSAFIEVQPITIKTQKPAVTLVKQWEEGLRRIERTGRPAAGFKPQSLAALKDFVSNLPKDVIVKVGNHASEPLQLTALTQRRVEEAAKRMPVAQKTEYSTRGSIRGRLAVLDSWKPEERSFTLQLPLAPSQPVKCTYVDQQLVTKLGDSFEGTVEITGKLHYKPDRPWPSSAEVESIRPLNKVPVSLKELAGLVTLPPGINSVSYVRSVRDAE
jgi:hypothetical protein